MADERRIVIELKAVGTSSASSSDNTDSGSSSSSVSLTDALKMAQHPIKSLEKATLGKNILVYRAYEQAKATIKNVATFQISRYFNLTENYKAEQDLNNTLNVISHIGSAGSSILGGAVAGSVFGPVGAAAGAVIGAIGWGANTITDAMKSWDQQNRQIIQMNMQSSFQQVRLGLVDDGRGTLN